MFDKADSHIILYAKGWYKKTDVIKDLQIIYGKRNNISLEFPIPPIEILSMLSDLIVSLDLLHGGEKFPTFLLKCFSPLNPLLPYKNTTTIKKVIEVILSELKFIRVIDNSGEKIIDLDQPDSSILPLSPNV